MTDPIVAESGVAFPQHPDTEVSVAGTFIRSGEQLQNLFIGLEPVVVIQPEYDADEDHVTFNIVAVDLDPAGLIEILDILKDGAEAMVAQQREMGLLDDPEVIDAEVVSDTETTA